MYNFYEVVIESESAKLTLHSLLSECLLIICSVHVLCVIHMYSASVLLIVLYLHSSSDSHCECRSRIDPLPCMGQAYNFLGICDFLTLLLGQKNNGEVML